MNCASNAVGLLFDLVHVYLNLKSRLFNSLKKIKIAKNRPRSWSSHESYWCSFQSKQVPSSRRLPWKYFWLLHLLHTEGLYKFCQMSAFHRALTKTLENELA